MASSAEDRALDALTKILESAISPDMLDAQKIILRRLALAGDLFPSRVPAPLNITQVGGYLNLLAKEPVLRAQVLASTLGVAGPNPPLGWEPTLPGLYFATRANDRPPGDIQAAIPVTFSIRNDFAAPLDAALKTVHDMGGTLPLLTPVRALPAANGSPPPADVLPFLGRTLQIVPSAALKDPATDPIAVGKLGAAVVPQVLSRQSDAAAVNAAGVAAQNWSLFACDAVACIENAINGKYIELTPILNSAGWYQPPLVPPVSLSNSGLWHTFTNVTGLVAGTTKLGTELSMLYNQGEIAQSSLRERLDWIWNGNAFAQGV